MARAGAVDHFRWVAAIDQFQQTSFSIDLYDHAFSLSREQNGIEYFWHCRTKYAAIKSVERNITGIQRLILVRVATLI